MLYNLRNWHWAEPLNAPTGLDGVFEYMIICLARKEWRICILIATNVGQL